MKERFIIPESKVPSLMAGAFDLHGEVKRLRDKGTYEHMYLYNTVFAERDLVCFTVMSTILNTLCLVCV